MRSCCELHLISIVLQLICKFLLSRCCVELESALKFIKNLLCCDVQRAVSVYLKYYDIQRQICCYFHYSFREFYAASSKLKLQFSKCNSEKYLSIYELFSFTALVSPPILQIITHRT